MNIVFATLTAIPLIAIAFCVGWSAAGDSPRPDAARGEGG